MPTTTINNPRSLEALTLLLFVPIPGYVLVCFDDDDGDAQAGRRTPPSAAFQAVADDLGDPRNNMDLQFLHCFKRDMKQAAESMFQITSYPTYILFQCGSDFKEQGRVICPTRSNRGGGGLTTQQLCSFAVETINGSNAKGDTLSRKLFFEAAIKQINTCLAHLGKKHNVDLSVDDDGFGCIKLGNYDCAFLTGRGGTCKIVCYIGNETHDNDPAILAEALCWNFDEDVVSGFTIGVERATGRFTLECTLHITEEGRWNVVAFDNLTQNFATAVQTCEQKFKDFRIKKQQQQEEVVVAKDELPPPDLIREKRLAKFGGNKVHGKTGGCWRCECCSRNYKTENQLSNHLASKCHKKTWRRYHRSQPLLLPKQTQASADLRNHILSTSKQAIAEPNGSRACPTAQYERQHREILRALVRQDKAERRENGGKLKSRLGIDGYRPTGTFYEI